MYPRGLIANCILTCMCVCLGLCLFLVYFALGAIGSGLLENLEMAPVGHDQIKIDQTLEIN